MTDETPEPTIEDRVASLEATVATLVQGLDTAQTATAVLQTRYGVLEDTNASLAARLDALEAK